MSKRKNRTKPFKGNEIQVKPYKGKGINKALSNEQKQQILRNRKQQIRRKDERKRLFQDLQCKMHLHTLTFVILYHFYLSVY